jgi:regulator of sigma E protease
LILDGLINIALLLVILVGLVVIHELGHFLVARRAGVRVHEFGVGFPPRARILYRGKDTIYSLNWLPIGGFVRLEGEEGESADPRAFVNQRLRIRLTVLVAGVAMNFALAWLIFSLIAGLADPISNIRIATVQAGSPAESAGLKGGVQIGTNPDGSPRYDATGDLIVAIDGQRFPMFDRIDVPDAPVAYLRAHAGGSVTLTVRGPDGVKRDVSVPLRSPEEAQASGALGIGVQSFEREDLQRGPLDAVSVGLSRTLDASTLILRGIRDLVTNLANPQVSGPVGIVNAVGVVRTELPPIFLVWMVGLLSANLAVVNALPFPPMDGGRIAMSLIQRFSGNKISPQLERSVYLVGFMALMALLAWITLFDIQRLGGG